MEKWKPPMQPHLVVIDMLSRAGIEPNAKALAGRDNLDRRGRSVRHCMSCDRQDIDTLPMSGNAFCQTCLSLRMSYGGTKGPGVGRFSGKCPTAIFLEDDRVRIATTISPEYLKGSDILEVLPAAQMRDVLREFVLTPPKQYAIITCGDAAVAATEFRLNIDPDHMLFSGPGWGSHLITDVNIDVVRYMLDIFTDLLGASEFYTYLEQKQRRADHRIVAIVEDRYPALRDLRPPQSTSAEAKLTAYLLPALVEKTVVEKEAAYV